MKSMRVLLPIGLCAGLGAAYLYLSPYVTVYFLSRAIRSNNAQSIAGFIELPSLRDSIRTQIQEYIEYSSKADGYDAAWTALAKGFGGAISEEVVVRATSPEGIERILRTGQFGLDQDSSEEPVPPSQDLSSASIKYLSFDRVVASFPADSEQSLRSVELTRRNLVDWKITSAKFDFTSPRSKGGASPAKIACGRAVSSVENAITYDERIPIHKMEKSSIDTPFPDRTHDLAFVLGGEKEGYLAYDSPGRKKVWGFINSARAEKLAQSIINSCGDIAQVGYYTYPAGGGEAWYYAKNGIFKGDCVPLGDPIPGWGWSSC